MIRRPQFTLRALLLALLVVAACFAGILHFKRLTADRREKARRLAWPAGEFDTTLWDK